MLYILVSDKGPTIMVIKGARRDCKGPAIMVCLVCLRNEGVWESAILFLHPQDLEYVILLFGKGWGRRDNGEVASHGLCFLASLAAALVQSRVRAAEHGPNRGPALLLALGKVETLGQLVGLQRLALLWIRGPGELSTG